MKQLALLSTGALLLPSCMEDHSKAPILLHNYKIDNDQELLLETLTAAIIPSGTTPGAKEVSAHLFTLKMLDDCYSKEDRDKYLKGMQQFDTAARTALRSFLCQIGSRPARGTAQFHRRQEARRYRPDLFLRYHQTDDNTRLFLIAILSHKNPGVRISARSLAWVHSSH